MVSSGDTGRSSQKDDDEQGIASGSGSIPGLLAAAAMSWSKDSDRSCKTVGKCHDVIAQSDVFLLTNSLSVRESSILIESSFFSSFMSIFTSLTPASLSNRCNANPFPLANNSFHLSDDSRSTRSDIDGDERAGCGSVPLLNRPLVFRMERS